MTGNLVVSGDEAGLLRSASRRPRSRNTALVLGVVIAVGLAVVLLLPLILPDPLAQNID